MRSMGARFQLLARLLATPSRRAAVLRQGAAERTQQAAFADQVFLARGAAVVVLAVAGQLLGDFRVELTLSRLEPYW